MNASDTYKLYVVLKSTLTVEEAAVYCNVEPSTVESWCREKKIKCSRPTGRLVYIAREDLDRFMQGNTSVTGAELDAVAERLLKYKNIVR